MMRHAKAKGLKLNQKKRNETEQSLFNYIYAVQTKLIQETTVALVDVRAKEKIIKEPKVGRGRQH